MGEKHAALTHVNFYRLCGWVSQEAERLMRERPTRVQAAAQASKALGLAVGDTTVANAQEATGVKWRAPNNAGANEARRTYKEVKADQEEVRALILGLRAEVDVLRGLAHQLFFELGVQPPPGYAMPPRGAHVNARLVNPQ